MKSCSLGESITFFTGEHGLCFAGHHHGAQLEGWRFGALKAPTGSKPRPSRRSGQGSEGLLLGTPPSNGTPKVREDQTAYEAIFAGFRVVTRRLVRAGRREHHGGVSNEPRSPRSSSGKTGRGVSDRPRGPRREGRRGLSGVVGPSELWCTQLVLEKLRACPGI